jgi:hypothetical protein
MSDALTRLIAASGQLAGLRAQIGDEMTRRNELIASAIESGHTVRSVARAAAVDPAQVSRIAAGVFADRQTAVPA